MDPILFDVVKSIETSPSVFFSRDVDRLHTNEETISNDEAGNFNFYGRKSVRRSDKRRKISLLT